MDSPVPKNELKAIEASLREWRNPVEFGNIAQRLSDRMPGKQFRRQPGLQFFREAINAADFAKALGCDLVRLCEGNWPDFETTKNGVVRGYELIEAIKEGRKRGEEDWESKKIEFVPVSEWHKTASMIPTELRKAVAKKVSKNYSPNKSSLAIYVNVGSIFGLRQKEIEADFHAATALAKDKFNEVWVFWGVKHYLLWQDSNASHEVYEAPIDLQAYG